MTDLEKLKALLVEWKVEHDVYENFDGHQGTQIEVQRGYVGFSISFSFDNEGKFEDMGAYE